MNNQSFSSELIVAPHHSGVQLVRPEKADGLLLRDLYKIPTSTYFMTQDNRCANVNEGAAELNGANSARELIKSDGVEYWDDAAIYEWKRNNRQVMQLQSLQVTDDSGIRAVDDSHIQMITLKMPWYHQEKVIGVLGITLQFHAELISQFSKNLTSIIATGLLNSQQLSPLHKMTQNNGEIYFSKREQQILILLIKNLTAKQIAEKLSLSKRTIEHHIDNIKSKANVNSKFALIEKYYWKINKDTES